MLDRKFVRENLGAVKEMLKSRRMTIDISEFENLDAERRRLLGRQESLRYLQNQTSSKIAELKQNKQDASELLKQMKIVSTDIKTIDPELSVVEEKLDAFLLNIPNMLHESVPKGGSEEENVVIRTFGEQPIFDFAPKDHVDLGADLGILDMERAAKISGARFPLMIGYGALLERALINFMLDLHTIEHGYTEVLPPFMVNSQAMTGTGQLPKFAEDLFHIDGRDLWLIPTAEVPVTNIYAREILNESQLSMKMCAYTPCFRSEAGSYGKDTRGLIRVHQFSKVELVKLARPEDSYDELESLTRDAEEVLKRLNLHYRVVALCGADVGFSAAKCYDLEVWLPGQGKYREISSCSNFEDYQARRAGIRFKSKEGKGTRLVHTLNGSGLAVGRTLVAVLENCQQKDGSIRIPDALRPYMRGMDHIIPITM